MRVEPVSYRWWASPILYAQNVAYTVPSSRPSRLSQRNISGTSSSAETANSTTTRLKARGTHSFTTRDQAINVGDSGVTVTVSDFHLTGTEQTFFAGKQKYELPSLSRAGAVTIQGTGGDDDISVRQDARGDTIVDVKQAGTTSSLNLGRIASLTLYGMAGDDKLDVSVKDYFGGVSIEGGDGEDEIDALVQNTFKRGVTIKGDAGDDKITLSGQALAVLLEGGTGDDEIDARQVDDNSRFSRFVYGNEGNDRIRGSPGNDSIRGGAGNDAIYGEAGDDSIWGDEGDDVISGGAGNDILQGGAGTDLLQGNEGDDILVGGAGNDSLYAGLGRDTLTGGAGQDAFAPLVSSPQEIFAYSRVGASLRVNVRGAIRSQPIVTDYAAYYLDGKILTDVLAAEDNLVDRNLVV